MVSFSLLAVAAIAFPSVLAAPPAQCDPSRPDLVYNRTESPCEIAQSIRAALERLDSNADSLWSPLSDMGLTQYPVLETRDANAVLCNPLMYMLISACAACQGERNTWPTWPQYTVNCPYTSQFPVLTNAMDRDTVIPSWAFIPPSASGNTFNLTMAIEVTKDGIRSNVWAAPLPEATVPLSGAVMTATAIATAVPTYATMDHGCSSGGNIAAAVLGGFIGCIALGGLLFHLIRRRRRAAQRQTLTSPPPYVNTSQEMMVQEKDASKFAA